MQLVLINIAFLAIGVSSRPRNDVNDIKITDESSEPFNDENPNFLSYDELSTITSSNTPSTVLLPPDLPNVSKTSLEIFGDNANVTLGTTLEVSDDSKKDLPEKKSDSTVKKSARKYSEIKSDDNSSNKTEEDLEDSSDDDDFDENQMLHKISREASEELNEEDVDTEVENNAKKFGLFPHFLNPIHIFDPINEKIAKLAALLTHPNGPAFPIWNKLQATGANLFGPNGAIFGLGQIGGHDYPFPYRKAREVSDDFNNIKNRATEEVLNYLQKLEEAAKRDSFILPYIEQYKKILENLLPNLSTA